MKHLWIKGVTEVDHVGTSHVRVFGRGEDGAKRSFLHPFEPYFYVNDKVKQRVEIVGSSYGGKTIHGERLTKIIVRTPSDVPLVRKDYKIHYEADIPFNHRFQIDHGIKSCFDETTDGVIPCANPGIKPKCVCEDIETLDSVDVDTAPQPVVSTCIKDEDTDRYAVFITTDKEVCERDIKEKINTHIGKELDFKVFKSKTEDELFIQRRKFLDVMIQPDVIFGWNYTNFDKQYMEARSKKVKFREYMPLDLMDGYKRINELTLVSDKLDDVAKAEFGIAKLPRRSIKDMLENDVDTLIAYNIIDVYLTSEINKKRGVIDHYQRLAETAGTDLDGVRYNRDVVDNTMLHFCHGKNVLPSMNVMDAKPMDKGASVQDPANGIFENAVVLDFTKAYPTTIIKCNLSPETKLPPDFDRSIPHHEMPSGRCYRSSPIGIVPACMKELIDQRNYYQRLEKGELQSGNHEQEKVYHEIQTSYKFIINSFFGVLSEIDKKKKKARFRMADGEIGDDITKSIREAIRWIKKYLADLDMLSVYVETDETDIFNKFTKYVDNKSLKVIYGDTDSCILTFPKLENKELMIVLINYLTTLLNRSLVDFASETFKVETGGYKLDFEKMFDSFFQGGKKKKYAALMGWKDGVWVDDRSFNERFYVRGLEIRRSDWPELTKTKMKELFKILLETRDKSEVSFFIQDLKSRFFQGEYNKIFKKPLKLNKLEYQNNAQQLRTAMHSNEYLGKNFKQGDRLFICFMKSVNKGPRVHDIAIEIDDDPEDFGVVDMETMWEKFVEKPFRRVTDPIWGKNSWSELTSGLQEQDLGDWL